LASCLIRGVGADSYEQACWFGDDIWRQGWRMRGVTFVLLVATAALERDRQVAIWLTKEAVRLVLPAEGVACDGCPPLPKPIGAIRHRSVFSY
jgi:hypothetical protein